MNLHSAQIAFESAGPVFVVSSQSFWSGKSLFRMRKRGRVPKISRDGERLVSFIVFYIPFPAIMRRYGAVTLGCVNLIFVNSTKKLVTTFTFFQKSVRLYI